MNSSIVRADSSYRLYLQFMCWLYWCISISILVWFSLKALRKLSALPLYYNCTLLYSSATHHSHTLCYAIRIFRLASSLSPFPFPHFVLFSLYSPDSLLAPFSLWNPLPSYSPSPSIFPYIISNVRPSLSRSRSRGRYYSISPKIPRTQRARSSSQEE